MKCLKFLSTMFVLCVFVNITYAYDLEKDGIYYKASTKEENSLIVTYKSDGFKSYRGDIIIPDTVIVGKKKYAVTAIGSNAFQNCPFLTSVNIPATIKSIGLEAFKGCSSLESIVIPNSVEKIESYAFKGCIGLKNVIIEDGETTLDVGYNTSSFMQGGYYYDGPNGLFSSCSIDTAYIGRNISHEYASWSNKYSPFNVVNNVVIGEKVTHLSQSLIYGSPNSVTVLNNLPPTINENAIRNYSSTNLFVPYPSLETYKSTPIWNEFQTILPFYKDYQVVFMIDGEVIDEMTVTEGSEIVPPSTPQKEGYTFVGWIDLPTTMPSKDIVIYGSYKVNNYKLIYIIDNTNYSTSDVEYGSTIEPIDEPQKEGHTFSGWSEIPETMPANDVIVEGSFSINSYTLIYKVDGEVYATDSIKYGSTIELIAEPTKEGHTFSGWSEIPETMPANDIIVEGSFSINTYNITYKVDGEIYATDSIKFGATIEPIAEPTKEGHTFSGWSEIPETMPANDVVIEGTFSINTYNITYKVDGEIYATDSIKFGATIESIAEPTKEGYTFSGWSEIPETMPAKDVVVEGSFSVNSYTVTFMVDGEVYETMTVEYGAKIEPIAEPIKEGHTFSGWSEIPATMPAEDVVVEGSFTINSYTLTYKVDGAVYKTETVVYGTAITPIAEPTKEGHTFSGWSEIPETMPAKDVVVEGTFSVNSYTLTYKVDGAVYKTETIAYGATITPIAEPTKEGHTFSGWKDIPATMPAKDIVVEGNFTINSYTLTYKVDGTVYKTETVVYGTAITPIAEPTKEGHTFSGWSEIPETMPAKDIVVEGSFSINSYTITYKVDGAVYKTETVVYGTAITPIAEPIKEGHTFSGWKDIPATMPAKDVVVEGNFTINSYTLTYKVDGAVYKTETVVYGTAITPIAEPIKEGHTFSGWSEIPATMPANDIVIEGSFSVNSYILTYKVDGAVYKTETIAYGATITPIAEPSKEGHTFSGWSEIPETMPANDVVVEGTFSVNSYTLTYKVDGAVYKTETIAYGATITPIAEPTKEGHTFSGWSEIPETMPAKDVVVEGTFSVNSYTVTFMVDGEIYETMTVEYGAEIELPTPPEKEGYIFTGWIGVPATMPAEDIVIEGRFEVDTTGINAITLDLEKNEVYNLKGQRITESENLTRGIYIVNGKKIFIK